MAAKGAEGSEKKGKAEKRKETPCFFFVNFGEFFLYP